MNTPAPSETGTAAPAIPPPGAETADPALLQRVAEGKAALTRGDLDDALRHFEAVVAEFPDRPEGHNNLGALYAALGRFDRADASFGRVLELLPDNANVRYNRGIVRIRQQRFDEAVADLEGVLAAFPEDADCWNNIGVANFLRGDYGTARLHFQRALELVPNYPNALLNLCDTETADGRRDAAIAACEDHLQRYGDTEVRRKLLDLLGDACQDLLAQAGAAAEQVLREAPEDGATRVRLGQLIQAREILSASAEAAEAE